MQTKLTNLESPLNCVRFYLAELLPPGTAKVLYLDADVIVKGDAAELRLCSARRRALCKPFSTGKGGKKQHAELFEPYRGRGDKCDARRR